MIRFVLQILLPLFLYLLSNSSVYAQLESSTDTLRKVIEPNSSESRDIEYSKMIDNQYTQRFMDFSDQLEYRNSEISRLENRISSLKGSIKREMDKKRKSNLKTNLVATESLLQHQKDQKKLIRRGIKIMQENKNEDSDIKLNTLEVVNNIETNLAVAEENLTNSHKENNHLAFEKTSSLDNQNGLIKDCEIMFNGVDQKSKKKRIETSRKFLFGHTHPKLKSYFKDNHFLKCHSKIISINNRYFLTLSISISSKDAIKNYGFIDANNPIKLSLINGELIYLSVAQKTNGTIETYTGNTNYELVLPLNKSDVKALTRSEIDKLGIMWSSGYEDYEIYEVDRLMNQINCVKEN